MISFSLFPVKDQVEVKINGDLDIDSTEVVGEQLAPSLKEFKTINLNLVNVCFIDSSGIGLLFHLVQTLKDAGVNITISNINADVLEVFEILDLPEILGEGVIV
jgi:anti-anti-sigma factor